MKKINFFILLSFLLSITAYSQNDDYLISDKNDTIYGRIIISFKTKFIPNGSKTKVEIDPNVYKGYHIDSSSESYESVKSPYLYGENIFLNIITSGKINLYAHVIPSSGGVNMGGMVFGGTTINGVRVGGMPIGGGVSTGGKVDYITSKNGSKPEITFTGDLIPKKKHKEAVKELIRDDIELVNELDTLNASTKNLIYIIEKYNANANHTEKTVNFIIKDTILNVNPCKEQIYSVKDSDLRKKYGQLTEPDVTPIFQGAIKDSFKKFVTKNYFENLHNSDLEYIIKVEFLVTCEGKAGNFSILTKSKHDQMISYIEKVNVLVNNMPDKWKPAKVNGNKVDCYQVLTFTIFRGELIKVSYE